MGIFQQLPSLFRGGDVCSPIDSILMPSAYALAAGQASGLRKRVASGEKKALLAREFGVSRETLYQYLRA